MNSTKVVYMNSTKVLSLFYHQSGIFSMALVAKPRVASQYHFNEKPHTITNDTVSHRVIMVIFVLLAMGSIQKQYLWWDGIYYHRSGKNSAKFGMWVYHP